MKVPTDTWNRLPYLVTKDDRLAIVKEWPEEWRTPPSGVVGEVGTEKGTSQGASMSRKYFDEEIEETG